MLAALFTLVGRTGFMSTYLTSLCACLTSLFGRVAVGCEDEESWGRAVKVLLDKNIPSCFTSMNASELELDSVALRKVTGVAADSSRLSLH
jgi:hypothetical protein